MDAGGSCSTKTIVLFLSFSKFVFGLLCIPVLLLQVMMPCIPSHSVTHTHTAMMLLLLSVTHFCFPFINYCMTSSQVQASISSRKWKHPLLFFFVSLMLHRSFWVQWSLVSLPFTDCNLTFKDFHSHLVLWLYPLSVSLQDLLMSLHYGVAQLSQREQEDPGFCWKSFASGHRSPGDVETLMFTARHSRGVQQQTCGSRTHSSDNTPLGE